jgi:hypothetical protein
MFKGVSNKLHLHLKKMKEEEKQKPKVEIETYVPKSSFSRKDLLNNSGKDFIFLDNMTKKPDENKSEKGYIKLLYDGSICGDCMFFENRNSTCRKTARVVTSNLVACTDYYSLKKIT